MEKQVPLTVGDLLIEALRLKKKPLPKCPVCDGPALDGIFTKRAYCVKDRTHWETGRRPV